MPFVKKPLVLPLVAIGETYPIPVSDSGSEYLITGTETITGSNVFQSSGTPVNGLTYVYKYQAAATYTAAFVVSFHGVALTATQALKNQIITAVYDSVAATWNVDIVPDLQQDGVIEAAKLAADSVTTAKILDANVTTAKILDANVTTAKIADSNVTTAKIADSNVTTAKIADSNVTTAKILDANVTTAKIADSNVTTAKILDANVTTAKIADSNVTTEKLETELKQEIFHIEMEATVAMLRTGYYKVPWPCTITEIDVRVSQVLAGGDLTVTPMDNAGTTMTGGPITIPLATAVGSGVVLAPSAQNTFTAGQYFRLQTSGAAVTDGLVTISVIALRT